MSRLFDQAQGLTEYHDPSTHEFVFNQRMLGIKEPKRTLKFYTEVLAMTLVKRGPATNCANLRSFSHVGAYA